MKNAPVCCRFTRMKNEQSTSFPLVLAGEGERVKVVHLRGGSLMRERLLSMGINMDDEILVVHKQHNGAVLIEKGGYRYALGGGMAHKINVRKA
jgi:ferrous iron transport protein A